MSFLARIFGSPRDRMALRPLYAAIVAKGRDPEWYQAGGVPDTIDGRFEMVAAMLTLVLVRLERDGEAAAGEAALLTETFIEDMDGSMRELGIGDVVVGKKVGKLMGALGGRIGAYREGLTGDGDLREAVARNIFRAAPPTDAALGFVTAGLRAFHAQLADLPLPQLVEGRLP